YSFLFLTLPFPPDTYTLSLHDALPIFPHGLSHVVTSATAYTPARESASSRNRIEPSRHLGGAQRNRLRYTAVRRRELALPGSDRSEEHTSELQSRGHLVCRLLLEKKKK